MGRTAPGVTDTQPVAVAQNGHPGREPVVVGEAQSALKGAPEFCTSDDKSLLRDPGFAAVAVKCELLHLFGDPICDHWPNRFFPRFQIQLIHPGWGELAREARRRLTLQRLENRSA